MDRPQPLSHEFLYHTRVLYTRFANLAVVKGSSLNLVVGTHCIRCCCGDVAVVEGLKYNFMYELSTRTQLSRVVAESCQRWPLVEAYVFPCEMKATVNLCTQTRKSWFL